MLLICQGFSSELQSSLYSRSFVSIMSSQIFSPSSWFECFHSVVSPDEQKFLIYYNGISGCFSVSFLRNPSFRVWKILSCYFQFCTFTLKYLIHVRLFLYMVWGVDLVFVCLFHSVSQLMKCCLFLLSNFCIIVIVSGYSGTLHLSISVPSQILYYLS